LSKTDITRIRKIGKIFTGDDGKVYVVDGGMMEIETTLIV
jgi:hypothetical protein